jgi:5-methylcytosine-specific restriction endonuclease McrA
MRYRTDNRPSSTTLRNRVRKYWPGPDGMLKCQNVHCAIPLDPKDSKAWHADHDIMWTHGGSDFPPNVRPLCTECHKHKTRRDVFKHAKHRRGIKNRDPEYQAKKKRKKVRVRSNPTVPGSKNSKMGRKYDKATKRFITIWRDEK